MRTTIIAFGLAAVASSITPATAHADLQIKKITNLPRLSIWSIKEPVVTKADYSYGVIAFQPGQKVKIPDVGGCVQTGGHGKTWKRYLDPSGDNSDHLYHGTIKLPGMAGSQRIIDFRNSHPDGYVIPATASGDMTLHLGYEDDNYGDNGYWGHDNGTGNQCLGVGPAHINISIEGAEPPTASLRIEPSRIERGSSATLSWSSTNTWPANERPKPCTASGDWFGDKAATGSESVTPAIAGTKTYTLTCHGAGGASPPASATLDVLAPVTFNQIKFVIVTGGDDLRGDSDAKAILKDSRGTVFREVVLKARNQPGWGNNTTHEVDGTLDIPRTLADLGDIVITLTSHNGFLETDDNWNIQNAAITLSDSGSHQSACLFNAGGNPLARLTGSAPNVVLTHGRGC